MATPRNDVDFDAMARNVRDDDFNRNMASHDHVRTVLTKDADTFYEMNGNNVTTLHFEIDGRPTVGVHVTTASDFLTRGMHIDAMLPHEVEIRDMKAGDRISMLGSQGTVSGYENGDGEGFVATNGLRVTRVAPGDVERIDLEAHVPGSLSDAVRRHGMAETEADRAEIASAYLEARTETARSVQSSYFPPENGGLIAQAAELGAAASRTAAKGGMAPTETSGLMSALSQRGAER